MSRHLAVTVYGLPQPQGSARGFVAPPKPGGTGRARAIITSANRNLGPWRSAIAQAVLGVHTGAPFTNPVSVDLTFTLPRPKSAPKSRTRPHVRPDLDKLVRGALDAITDAGAWRDDAQVVSIRAMKTYPDLERRNSLDRPGLVLNIWELKP